MNCEWIKEHVSEMLDGLLTPEEQAEAQAHLDICAECSLLVSEVKQDMSLLQGLGDIPVPVELKQRIAHALAKPKLQKNPWRFFLPRLAPVAAAVLISVLSINTVPGYLASRQKLTQEAQPDLAPRLHMAAPASEPDETDPEGEPTERVYTATTGDGLKVNGTEDMLTMSASQDAKPSLWVVTSAAGSTVLLLWGAVVYRWYKKV